MENSKEFFFSPSTKKKNNQMNQIKFFFPRWKNDTYLNQNLTIELALAPQGIPETRYVSYCTYRIPARDAREAHFFFCISSFFCQNARRETEEIWIINSRKVPLGIIIRHYGDWIISIIAYVICNCRERRRAYDECTPRLYTMEGK